jgi:hypothetical protein
MKLTRRQLVAAAAGSVAAVKAPGQTAGSGTVQTDLAKQARDKVQSNADTLAKFEIPMSTEPAFRFKA